MCLANFTGWLELKQVWARESQSMLYQDHLVRTAGAWADVGRGPKVHGTKATKVAGRAVSWTGMALGPRVC